MNTPEPVTIIVPGNSRPEAKHQVSRGGSWTRRVDKPQSVDFKAKCALFAKQAMVGRDLFDEPLEVWFVWRKPKPSGYRKHENEWHKKPDLNNLCKIAEDALTGIVWRDDSLICTSHERKEFAEVEELEVRVQVLHEDWAYRKTATHTGDG